MTELAHPPVLPISEDEKRVRKSHSTENGLMNILDQPMCDECEDVYPCAEIRALDGLRAEIDAILETCRETFGFRNMLAMAKQAEKKVTQ